MGKIQHTVTDSLHQLSWRSLIGRSTLCLVRVAHPCASAEHAMVFWGDSTWCVRDLGSRNGTFLNGRRLPAGKPEGLVAGDLLAFGSPEGAWRMVESSPPDPIARSGEAVVRGAQGQLFLPGPEVPEALVQLDRHGQWLVEDGAGVRAVMDGEIVDVADRRWILHLPRLLTPTQELDEEEPPVEIHAHFAVRSDEEHVRVTLWRADGPRQTLPVRSYHYMLLTLARLRLRDADLPESERGWVHIRDLSRMLKLDESTLNVYIWRARRQAHKTGLLGPSDLIARRGRTGVLRLAIRHLVVGPPER